MLTHELDTHGPTYDVEDDFAANELFQRLGWTDGLPIVAPTPDRVARFLEVAGLGADDVVGTEPVREKQAGMPSAGTRRTGAPACLTLDTRKIAHFIPSGVAQTTATRLVTARRSWWFWRAASSQD